jgi:hypothetical protein
MRTLTALTRRALLLLLILLVAVPASASIKLTNAVRTLMCDAAVDSVDAGSGAGTIEIRTGAQPTNADDTDSGTLLATLTFSDPAFGACATGVGTASSITSDSSADATGTAGYFVVKDSTGTKKFTGSIGTSGADMNLVTTSITAGQPVQITSFTFTVPQQ